MKSVLISINPKWCELIASGKKTVEVRKTQPIIATPFKVYIYETKSLYKPNGCRCFYEGRGQVIGEFVCDKIYDITPHFDTPTFPNQYICGWEYGKEFDCFSFEELTSYLNGKKGYAWHITDLVIYEKPKELGEFKTFCKTFLEGDRCEDCKYFIDGRRGYEYDEGNCSCDGLKPLERPPQSWFYVEELKP